jgi:hypothetical protein
MVAERFLPEVRAVRRPPGSALESVHQPLYVALMKWKPRNLRELAEIVCGDAEQFHYRSSFYIVTNLPLPKGALPPQGFGDMDDDLPF